MGGDDESQAVRFQAVGDGQRSNRKGVRHHRGTGGAANRAEMGCRIGGQVRTEMKLHAKKHGREEQGQDAESSSVLVHVINGMELKKERLRGQGAKCFLWLTLDTILGDSIWEDAWHTPRRTKTSF